MKIVKNNDSYMKKYSEHYLRDGKKCVWKFANFRQWIIHKQKDHKFKLQNSGFAL